MEQWKTHMRAGNVCFENEQFSDAQAHYHMGGERAQQLFTVWFDRPQAVAAVVITYHNRADLLLAQQQISAAERELRSCYDFLYQAASSAACVEEVDTALLQGLRRSYMRLLSHLQVYGACAGEMPVLFDTGAFVNTTTEIKADHELQTP